MTGLPTNPIAAVLVALILILFGSGAGGAVLALRKDKRQADKDEVDLTELVRSVASKTIQELSERVEKLQRELDTVRQQSVRDLLEERARADRQIKEERERSDKEIQEVSWKLNKRIAQLENAIRRMPGGIVPPWLEDTPPGEGQ